VKLKDFPLPLQEDWGTQQPPKRTLRLLADATDHAWWDSELNEYNSVGLETDWTDFPLDPWTAATQSDRAIGEALGVPIASPDAGAVRQYVQIDTGSPLHVVWGRLLAQRLTSDESHCIAVSPSGLASFGKDATAVDVKVSPATLQSEGAIPRCPGPFGGTTVLVVDETSEAALQPWIDLEAADPLNKQSRFHRLRVATNGAGERGLRRQLETLLEQKRSNVLIVPAKFYAGESLMRALEEQVIDLSDRMTIHWRPGLGGLSAPTAK
jgi:hypothetical protein